MHADFPTLSGKSGAAFLLDASAQVSLTLNHPGGLVTVRQGAPFATVSLHSQLSQEDAKEEAWRILQEAFDVFAAARRATLQTAEGECTYMVWVADGAGYELVFVDTADAPWSMSISLSVEDAQPPLPASAPSPFPSHPALRFYRLANASADLFDAFRNAYLALECLASDATPKGASESELNWLKRALSGPLAAGVPPGVIGPGTVDGIYKDGRLPTFHAKTGSTFYAPHGPERQAMQTRFDELTLLVNCLLQHRFGHAVVSRGGEVSQGIYDSMAAASFSFNEIILQGGSIRTSVAAVVQPMSTPRRFNQLWGRTTVACPTGIHWVDTIETQKDGNAWTSSVLDERVPLQGVSKISLELNLLQYYSGSKRPVHRR